MSNTEWMDLCPLSGGQAGPEAEVCVRPSVDRRHRRPHNDDQEEAKMVGNLSVLFLRAFIPKRNGTTSRFVVKVINMWRQ